MTWRTEGRGNPQSGYCVTKTNVQWTPSAGPEAGYNCSFRWLFNDVSSTETIWGRAVKYSRESRGTRNQEPLCWRVPDEI
jgi:hypothetical protein